MFSDVLHKGDLNDGFNGAINGMSIVNCLENESPSAGEFLTLLIVCYRIMYNKCNFHRLNTWVINYVNSTIWLTAFTTCVCDFYTRYRSTSVWGLDTQHTA